jgi:hypothetical protein
LYNSCLRGISEPHCPILSTFSDFCS